MDYLIVIATFTECNWLNLGAIPPQLNEDTVKSIQQYGQSMT